MGEDFIIEASNITKRYGKITALDGVSFVVKQGIFGVFGPNGAGKTTLMRLILGILKPDSGKITVKETNVSYIPEALSLYRHEKVANLVKYLLALKKVPRRQWSDQIEKWSSLLGVEKFFNRRVSQLSKGEKKKITFLTALLGEPKLIVMDEPFVGLDVEAAEGLRKMVVEMKKQGATIIFSTHILEHAEELCEEVIIIKKGKIIERGNILGLKNKYSPKGWIIRYEGDLGDVVIKNVIKKEKEIICSEETDLGKVISLLQSRVEILEVKRMLLSFKEIYLKLVKEM